MPPSGEKETCKTGAKWPYKVLALEKSVKLVIITFQSSPALAKNLLSGEKATQFTVYVCSLIS